MTHRVSYATPTCTRSQLFIDKPAQHTLKFKTKGKRQCSLNATCQPVQQMATLALVNGWKKGLLLLLPLGRDEASLGLWRSRQRHDLLVIAEPADLWLVWVDLPGNHSKVRRCKARRTICWWQATACIEVFKMQGKCGARLQISVSKLELWFALLDFRLTRFHKLCLITETSDGTDRCESSSVKLKACSADNKMHRDVASQNSYQTTADNLQMHRNAQNQG